MRMGIMFFTLFHYFCYAEDVNSHSSDNELLENRTNSKTAREEQLSENKQEEMLVKLIGEIFFIRSENASTHMDVLVQNFSSENESGFTERLAELVNSIDEKQQNEALIRATEELKGVKGNAEVFEQVLRRVKWGLEEKLNKKRTDSSTENKFKEEFTLADDNATEKAVKFRNLVKKANQGDLEARNELLTKFKSNELLDFIGSKVDSNEDDISSEVTKLLGWKDVNGNIHLDVKGKEEQDRTWTLGKTSAEIRQSLKSFNADGHSLKSSSINTSHLGTERQFLKAEEGKIVSHNPKVIAPEDNESLCNPKDPSVVKSVNTKRVPGYFFRPFPISNMGSYAADDHNYVLSLDNEEGSQEMIIPGSYDPVPTPDEMYMTIPSDNQSDPKKGITFFSMSKLLAGETEPLFVDTDFKGVYQSIGTRKQDAVSPIYRVLTDYNLPENKETGESDGLAIRDYKITRQRGDNATVQPFGKGPMRICSGMKFSLPMMSKDGKQFSAMDLSDNKTKIFNILEDANGTPTGACEVSMDLGISTGKVDFNFNNDEITFHKFNYDPDEVKHGYNEVPSDDFVGNVYVYKRSTGVISRLTNNTDSNAIYPAFRQDGKIVYINHPRRGEGYSGPSTLVISDPNLTPRFTFDYFPAENDTSEKSLNKMKSMAALGLLWNQLCSPFSSISTVESAVLSPLGLVENDCLKMIDSYWDKMKSEITGHQDDRIAGTEFAKISAEELKKVCPKPKEIPSVVQNNTGDNGQTRPRAPIPSSCRHCHSFEWDNPEWLKNAVTVSNSNPGKPLIEDIIRRVSITDVNDPDRMPARNGGAQYLLDTEKNALLDYLNKLKNER